MMLYISVIKKKEILPFVTTWMKLEGIMLSEINQIEKRLILYDLFYVESEKPNS